MPALPPVAGERFAALALWCVQGLTRHRITRLVERSGSFEAALQAVPEARAAGEQALEIAAQLGASFLVPGDLDWPVGFEEVDSRPGALFVLGQLPSQPAAVAIVGARHATTHGLRFAEGLSAALASGGTAIVSGGALGVDGAAHRGALGHGPSVAVLGCGLDRPYPPEHRQLFLDLVADGGAVVSEFPFGTPPVATLFPRRNRLIAALAKAVVVVQAAPRSGSLITARDAQRLGRPVLAVPGTPGDAVSEGTNALLREGAFLCTGAQDVWNALERGPVTAAVPRRPRAAALRQAELPLAFTAAARLPKLDPVLAKLHALLGVAPRPLDEMSRAAQLTAAQTAAALSRLELLGLAEQAAGGCFTIPSRNPASPASGKAS